MRAQGGLKVRHASPGRDAQTIGEYLDAGAARPQGSE
jgi:hypothetical protein